MSWSIEPTALNGDGIAALEGAIGAAARAGILMFCAANDQGVAVDHSYPAACANTKKIFKIGAADSSGAASNKVGDDTTVDFFFPGQNVMHSHREDLMATNNKALSGSSIATALAAALAAVILHCIQVAALDTEAPTEGDRVITQSDFDEVKQHKHMEGAFLNMCSNSKFNPKFLEVWHVAEPAFRDYQNGCDRVEILTKVAETVRTRRKYKPIS